MCLCGSLSDGSSRAFPISVLGKLQCVDAEAVFSGTFGGMGGSWGGGKQMKRGESCGWEFPA